jgi:hypothetical protein
MNFTPGPWTVKGKQSIRGPHGEYIAKTNWENGAENARLIAAAPDLLSALRRAVIALAFAAETSPAMHDDYKAVSAAIAKATGDKA